jgi:hypothetical protein
LNCPQCQFFSQKVVKASSQLENFRFADMFWRDVLVSIISLILMRVARMMIHQMSQDFGQSHSGVVSEQSTTIQKREEEKKLLRRRRVDGQFQIMVKFLTRILGNRMNKTGLLELAQSIVHSRSIKLDRRAKRSKEMLICWFCENINDFLCTLSNLSQDHSASTKVAEQSPEPSVIVSSLGCNSDDEWAFGSWEFEE